MANRTDQEKLALIDKVNELRKNGVSIKDAATQAGISWSQFYGWRKKIFKISKKRGTVTQTKQTNALTTHAPKTYNTNKRPYVKNQNNLNQQNQESGRLVVLIGDVQSVKEALATFSF